jgi:vacuolar-type H+-ATPase subunit H
MDMEKDILSEVIETEKEIQKCLEQETQKAKEWLEDVRNKAALELKQAEQEYTTALEQAMADAEREAAARALAVRKNSEMQADHLGKLDDRILKSILERRIKRILPG